MADSLMAYVPNYEAFFNPGSVTTPPVFSNPNWYNSKSVPINSGNFLTQQTQSNAQVPNATSGKGASILPQYQDPNIQNLGLNQRNSIILPSGQITAVMGYDDQGIPTGISSGKGNLYNLINQNMQNMQGNVSQPQAVNPVPTPTVTTGASLPAVTRPANTSITPTALYSNYGNTSPTGNLSPGAAQAKGNVMQFI